jgi:hypothetical protein
MLPLALLTETFRLITQDEFIIRFARKRGKTSKLTVNPATHLLLIFPKILVKARRNVLQGRHHNIVMLDAIHKSRRGYVLEECGCATL